MLRWQTNALGAYSSLDLIPALPKLCLRTYIPQSLRRRVPLLGVRPATGQRGEAARSRHLQMLKGSDTVAWRLGRYVRESRKRNRTAMEWVRGRGFPLGRQRSSTALRGAEGTMSCVQLSNPLPFELGFFLSYSSCSHENRKKKERKKKAFGP